MGYTSSCISDSFNQLNRPSLRLIEESLFIRCATRLLVQARFDLYRSVAWNVLSGYAWDDRQLLMISSAWSKSSRPDDFWIRTFPAQSTASLAYWGLAQAISRTTSTDSRFTSRPPHETIMRGRREVQWVRSHLLYGTAFDPLYISSSILRQEFVQIPHVICYSSLHRGCNPQCHVDLTQVIPRYIKRHSSL